MEIKIKLFQIQHTKLFTTYEVVLNFKETSARLYGRGYSFFNYFSFFIKKKSQAVFDRKSLNWNLISHH